jgi:hypothetical protein
MPEIGQIIAFEGMRDKQTLSLSFLNGAGLGRSRPIGYFIRPVL